MFTDPLVREFIAMLVLLIVAAAGAVIVIRLFTRKRREREKLQKFHQTRIRF
jgi:type II secretory pathway pseudopilin PulG